MWTICFCHHHPSAFIHYQYKDCINHHPPAFIYHHSLAFIYYHPLVFIHHHSSTFIHHHSPTFIHHHRFVFIIVFESTVFLWHRFESQHPHIFNRKKAPLLLKRVSMSTTRKHATEASPLDGSIKQSETTQLNNQKWLGWTTRGGLVKRSGADRPARSGFRTRPDAILSLK